MTKSFSHVIAALAMLGAPGAAQAGGVDVGGLIGGIGGIMQGAAQMQMQREQMRQQLELQKQLLREQQLRGTTVPAFAPAPAESASPTGTPAARTIGAEAFQVDSHALGSSVSYGEMSDLTCHDSEQFTGFEWCRGTRNEKGVQTGVSLMRSSAGDIAYYSKFYPSAVFTAGAVRSQIDEISTRHRLNPHVETMPSSDHGDGAVIATWGQVRLVRLGAEVSKVLAEGAQVQEGVLVDFLSNARLSAKRGLPVFRLSGGAGYYWVAQWGRTGKGTLRFGITDASAWESHTPPPPDTRVAGNDPAPAVKPAEPPRAPSTATPPVASAQVQAPSAPRAPAESPAVPVAEPPPLPDQGRRVALVIGNSAYDSVPRLPNPSEDAEAVADTLRLVGFDSVVLVEDASLQKMKAAMIDFEHQADEADWAVLYYAGHGIEIGGQNYLIPVDAKLVSDRDADDEAYTLRRVLDKMRNARRLHLAIIDACRDNPFQANMKRQIAVRSVTRGLAPVEPAVPTEMIVYSARDGSQALDGDSVTGHSPFAKALIARLAMPRVEINKMFRQITADVLASTKGQQQPFVYGSIPGDDDFYFKVR